MLSPRSGRLIVVMPLTDRQRRFVANIGLVTAYLRAALGGAFPWGVAAAGQVFYLVLFPYSFFLVGVTGLTITIGSVATLAMLMKVTAQIDWSALFAKPRKVARATT